MLSSPVRTTYNNNKKNCIIFLQFEENVIFSSFVMLGTGSLSSKENTILRQDVTIYFIRTIIQGYKYNYAWCYGSAC